MDNSRIEELINGCWFDTVGIHIEPTTHEDIEAADSLCIATVVFTGGEGQGSLTVAMKTDIAKRFAGKMFDIPLDQLSNDDISDSMGEIANVLAGNLKTNFFRDNELSKPLIMDGGDDVLAMFKVDAIYQKVFLTENKEPLVIQICQTY